LNKIQEGAAVFGEKEIMGPVGGRCVIVGLDTRKGKASRKSSRKVYFNVWGGLSATRIIEERGEPLVQMRADATR
jgi:hypothetical protein